jgi:CRISPR-associated endonuclease/helicase Cas3
LPTDPDAMEALCSPSSRAPTLLPAHVDAWAQTEPLPVPDPDVSLFLHGPRRSADVQLVWRADLFDDPDGSSQESLQQAWTQIVSVVPPTTLEALPVPIHAARAWLAQTGAAEVADIEAQTEPNSTQPQRRDRAPSKSLRNALRWRGPEESTILNDVSELRPGDTVVVPATYGGTDKFGWNPAAEQVVEDLGDVASLLARGKPVLRVCPDVIAGWQPIARDGATSLDQEVRRRLESGSTDDEIDAGVDPDEVLTVIASWPDLPPWAKLASAELVNDRLRRDVPYGPIPSGRSFVARGSKRLAADALREIVGEEQLDKEDAELLPASDPDGPTSDDASSFRDLTHAVTLLDHCEGVAQQAARFAAAIGLPDCSVGDLSLAGRIHDAGKSDPRFQVWLHGGDEIAALASEPLAKSASKRQDRASLALARELAGYPEHARHEALSVALAQVSYKVLASAADRDLVLHLVGTHHGWGRPFWPVASDPDNVTVTHQINGVALSAPARHGLERLDSGWPERFWSLVRSYGPWGLALLEAILILADHQRSRSEQEDSDGPAGRLP